MYCVCYYLFTDSTIVVFADYFYVLFHLEYVTCRQILYFLCFVFIYKFRGVCTCGVYIF